MNREVVDRGKVWYFSGNVSLWALRSFWAGYSFQFSKVRQGDGCLCGQMLQMEQKSIHFSLRVPDSSQTSGGEKLEERKAREEEWKGAGVAEGSIQVSGDRCSVGLSGGRQPQGRVSPLQCPGKFPDPERCRLTPSKLYPARPTDSFKRSWRECGTQPPPHPSPPQWDLGLIDKHV